MQIKKIVRVNLDDLLEAACNDGWAGLQGLLGEAVANYELDYEDWYHEDWYHRLISSQDQDLFLEVSGEVDSETLQGLAAVGELEPFLLAVGESNYELTEEEQSLLTSEPTVEEDQ